MKKVAVLGAARRVPLQRSGWRGPVSRQLILDEKLAWEKPCGGGLTYKAYQQYPFLIENDTPKKLVHETTWRAQGGRGQAGLTQPLVIYSRFDLNKMLLERAETAGAQIEKTRVLGIGPVGAAGWRMRTRDGSLEADFCMVATGARNPLRDVGTQYTAADTMTRWATTSRRIRIKSTFSFCRSWKGYIWVFPRCGHLSVGICGKGEPAQALRVRLERYMDEKGIAWRGATFYSHVLPSLESPGWKNNRVAGEGWMAVGDAGGLVDPITGEGLYYAMRSGDLASQRGAE